MLCAYFDETGHSADPKRRFVGIGGFLARAEAWQSFDCKWRELCAAACIASPFHMTDFNGFRGQFENWRSESDHKRMNFLEQAINIIEKANPTPVGAIVSVEDFRSLRPDQQAQLRDPYFVAFQECTYQLAFAVAITAPREKVQMVYARQKEFSGSAGQLWNVIKEHNPLLGFWMNSYTVAEPRERTPLQAADIWAYELGRHFEYVLPNKSEWRWAFRRFVQMAVKNSVGHRFFTYFDSQEMLDRLGEF